MRYIILLFLTVNFCLHAQLSTFNQRSADSIQKIISKTKNDTAVIYFESLKDNYIYYEDPLRSLRSVRPLFELAKRTDHSNSIIRMYCMWERALLRYSQLESNIVKKEMYLTRVDSLLNKHLSFVTTHFVGEALIINADYPTNSFRWLGEASVERKKYFYDKQTSQFDLLVNKYNLKKYPDRYMSLAFGMAVGLQNALNSSLAAKYYLQLAQFADSLRRFDRAMEYYNNLGFTYFADGNLGAAQRYYFLSLKSMEKLPPDSFTVTEAHKDRLGNKGVTLSNIANVFFIQKNYQQSADYYKRALPYFKDADATEFYLSMVLRVGFVYAHMLQLDSAEVYLQKEKKLTYMLTEKRALLTHEIRINSLKGFILAQKKQYHDAIVYAQNVVRLSEQLDDKNAMSGAYESIGGYYVSNNEPKKAIPFYNKQLVYASQVGWKAKTLAKIYTNKGKAFIKDHNADSAIANLLMAKEIAEKVNVKLEMNSVYQNLAEAYILGNNMNEAVVYLKKHIQYKDSLVGDQVTQQVTSMALKYEEDLKLLAEKNIREKERLENEKKSEQEAQHRKILMIIIISVSLLVVVAAFSLFKINKANVLLKEQKTEIEQQRNLVTHQKHIVEEKNKEITDSIQYAKRIQTALIQTQPHFENFKDHFIFFKPKDIVSGDFYWSAMQNEHLYIAACDCTGHGVPGAFMSLLNISFLNEAVVQKKLIEPNKVFDFVKSNLVTNLSFDDSKDGMDACLLHINKNTKTITYSAANNKPVIIRNNELIELPCDKMPVGKSYSENEFTLYTIDYKANDILYMFTDGYKDQFGGKENKKLNSKMFKKLLLEFSRFDFSTQKEKIKDFFNEWRGNVEQTDDVCVIGLKL